MKNKFIVSLAAIAVNFVIIFSTMGQGRFSIAPTISPTYQNIDFASSFDNVAGLRGEQVNKGISAGLMATYGFTHTWSLSAGLLYSHSSGTWTYHYDNPLNVETIATKHDYFQVPVLLNYSPSSRRLSPYFSGGGVVNYNKLGGPDAFTLYGMIGLGVQYRLSSTLALIVQPTAAYRLNAPAEGYPISYTHYNDYLMGLQTQLKFTF